MYHYQIIKLLTAIQIAVIEHRDSNMLGKEALRGMEQRYAELGKAIAELKKHNP